MRILQPIFIVLLLTFFTACSDDNSTDVPTNTARTAEDVRSDFQKLEINPGINDLRLESLEEGVFWNFRVIAPTNNSPSNLRPLVLALHGASGGSPTAHLNTDCYVEPGLEALDAFIISPNAGTDEWYDASNQLQILALVDLASDYWNVDTDKVMVMGYSNGGNASWFYSDYFGDLFTAAIAMASSYNPQRTDGSVPKINVPLYVIHGSNDELFPVATTTEFVEMSQNAGTSIEYVIAEGLTHYRPCDYVSVLQDGVDWVLAEVWNN